MKVEWKIQNHEIMFGQTNKNIVNQYRIVKYPKRSKSFTNPQFRSGNIFYEYLLHRE